MTLFDESKRYESDLKHLMLLLRRPEQLQQQSVQQKKQLSRMINEQLAQAQMIESLRRQVKASNTAARDSQALLRANQDQQQQSWMLPSPNYPIGSRSSSNTPFVRPFSTPTNYYHVGSPADV